MDLMDMLIGVRIYFVERLHGVFPEPAGSFAAGILFGERATLPKQIVQEFKRTGLTHILALSGFNIIILVSFLAQIFSFLPKRAAIVVTISVIVLFVLMVGAPASVVRAAIMGCLQLVGKFFGRRARGIRSLLIAAAVMLIFDPLLILDIGFELSFAATAGILIIQPILEKRFEKLPTLFGTKEILLTSWAAQVFTTPIIFFYFRSFSVISLIANVFVLPFIPLLMLGSFLAMILGKILAAPTYLLFEAVLAIIHFFSEIPFSFIDFGTS